MTSIIRTSCENPDFIFLITFLDADLDLRYGIIQEQYNQYNKIDAIKNAVIAYIDEEPIGCGSFKFFDNETVEIKRMFVLKEHRGTGIAPKILTELEQWAVEIGFEKAILETGFKQPESIRFYEKMGYSFISNYGQYIGNTNSVCMSKPLKIR